ncbi:ankyrin [Xylariaceae sp. AK1471]|nr:ankyrin [Xylariaceae sp. AK1471]
MRQLQELHQKLCSSRDKAPLAEQRVVTPDENIGDAVLKDKVGLHSNSKMPSRTRNLLKRLAWPFKRDEIAATCASLHHCVQAFNFCLNIENCKEMLKSQRDVLHRLEKQEQALQTVADMTDLFTEDMRKRLQQIQETQRLLIASTSDLSSISAKIDDLDAKFDADYFRKVVQWISPVDFRRRHEMLSSMRANGTCRELLEDERFVSWFSGASEERHLCCFGNPGAGKSVYCSAVIDQLLALHGSSDDTLICYVYLEYQLQQEQMVDDIRRLLLKQAVLRSRRPSHRLREAYESGEQSLATDVLKTLAQEAFDQFDKIYLCVDALDESVSPDSVLESVRELSQTTRVFLTGRRSVEYKVREAYISPIILEITAGQHDIKQFLEIELEKEVKTNPGLMKDDLREGIIEKLMSSADGIFLLPALHIANILGENTIKRRRNALGRLPDTLDGAYDATIARIKMQSPADSELAIEILTWVHYAARPLTIAELRHAVSIEVGAEDFDEEDLPNPNLLSLCLGLVMLDVKEERVSFVHFTLKEYFQKSAATKLNLGGHKLLAQKCLTYISYKSTTVPLNGGWEKQEEGWGTSSAKYEHPTQPLLYAEDARTRVFDFPNRRYAVFFTWEDHLLSLNALYALLNYASCQWGFHVEQAAIPDSSLTDFVIRYLLLEGTKLQVSSANFMLSRDVWHISRHENNAYVHPWISWIPPRLHLVAFFGLCDIWKHLKRTSLDLHSLSLDGTGRPPLIYACYGGKSDMVQLILSESDSNIDRWGTLSVLSFLSPLPGNERSTEGSCRILECILQHQTLSIDLSAVFSEEPYTILWLPDIKIARLVVSHPSFNVNVGPLEDMRLPNGGPKTLLHYALLPSRSDFAAQALIETDDIELQTNKLPSGSPPYSTWAIAASDNGQLSTSRKLILEHPRVDINEMAFVRWGWPPLMEAILRNCRDAVDVLLKRDDLLINRPFVGNKFEGGETALHLSAWVGSLDVLKRLLEDPRIDKNAIAADGRSALNVAIENGNTACAEMLLSDVDVDLDTVIQKYHGSAMATRQEKIQTIRPIIEELENKFIEEFKYWKVWYKQRPSGYGWNNELRVQSTEEIYRRAYNRLRWYQYASKDPKGMNWHITHYFDIISNN